MYEYYSNVDSKGEYLEVKLDAIFNRKNKGFFIELGAYDGLFQSNTAFFEKSREWTGILIEPSLEGYNKCIINRPGSTCFNYACVSNDYKNDFVYGDFSIINPLSSINGTRKKSNNLIKVNSISLEVLLDNYYIEHNYNNIDFLSLDTEGYEFNILKGLNLNKYRPNYILVEIYNFDYDNIYNYLIHHKYKLHSNFTNYNNIDNPNWDGSHNDYLFIDETIL